MLDRASPSISEGAASLDLVVGLLKLHEIAAGGCLRRRASFEGSPPSSVRARAWPRTSRLAARDSASSSTMAAAPARLTPNRCSTPRRPPQRGCRGHERIPRLRAIRGALVLREVANGLSVVTAREGPAGRQRRARGKAPARRGRVVGRPEVPADAGAVRGRRGRVGAAPGDELGEEAALVAGRELQIVLDRGAARRVV